jgi:hypothetical protein
MICSAARLSLKELSPMVDIGYLKVSVDETYYIYDTSTNDLIKVDEVVYEIIDDYMEHGPGFVTAKHGACFSAAHLATAVIPSHTWSRVACSSRLYPLTTRAICRPITCNQCYRTAYNNCRLVLPNSATCAASTVSTPGITLVDAHTTANA